MAVAAAEFVEPKGIDTLSDPQFQKYLQWRRDESLLPQISGMNRGPMTSLYAAQLRRLAGQWGYPDPGKLTITDPASLDKLRAKADEFAAGIQNGFNIHMAAQIRRGATDSDLATWLRTEVDAYNRDYLYPRIQAWAENQATLDFLTNNGIKGLVAFTPPEGECAECQAAAAASPYDPENAPVPPLHPHCVHDLTMASFDPASLPDQTALWLGQNLALDEATPSAATPSIEEEHPQVVIPKSPTPPAATPKPEEEPGSDLTPQPQEATRTPLPATKPWDWTQSGPLSTRDLPYPEAISQVAENEFPKVREAMSDWRTRYADKQGWLGEGVKAWDAAQANATEAKRLVDELQTITEKWPVSRSRPRYVVGDPNPSAEAIEYNADMDRSAAIRRAMSKQFDQGVADLKALDLSDSTARDYLNRAWSNMSTPGSAEPPILIDAESFRSRWSGNHLTPQQFEDWDHEWGVKYSGKNPRPELLAIRQAAADKFSMPMTDADRTLVDALRGVNPEEQLAKLANDLQAWFINNGWNTATSPEATYLRNAEYWPKIVKDLVQWSRMPLDSPEEFEASLNRAEEIQADWHLSEHFMKVADDFIEHTLPDLADGHFDSLVAQARTYLDTNYQLFQAFAKDQGMTSIKVIRGLNMTNDRARSIPGLDILQDGQTIPVVIKNGPIASWSTDPGVAVKFADLDNALRIAGDRGYLLTVDMPVERIYSVAFQGMGCINELEYVCASDVTPCYLTRADDPIAWMKAEGKYRDVEKTTYSKLQTARGEAAEAALRGAAELPTSFAALPESIQADIINYNAKTGTEYIRGTPASHLWGYLQNNPTPADRDPYDLNNLRSALHARYGKADGQAIYDQLVKVSEQWEQAARPDLATLTPEPSTIDTRTAADLARDLITKASTAEPTVTPDMVQAASAGNGELIGLEHRLKTAGSLARKITEDAVEKDQTIRQVAEKVGDALRFTTTYTADAYWQGVARSVEAMESQGYRLVKWKDTWASNIYKGINTQWLTPDGTRFEMQFHTPESFHLKEAVNHPFYEEWRLKATPTDRKEELAKIMADNASTLTTPPL